MLRTFTKDPDSRMDFGVDWEDWLESTDAIADSTWLVDGTDLVVDDGSQFSATKAVVWLTGGTIGEVYRVTNRITTSEGRLADRSFRIRVKQL